MNEKDVYRLMMWSAAVLAVVAGLATVTLLVLTVAEGIRLLVPTMFLGVVTVGSGLGTVYFGQRVTGHEKVFANPIEQEVLSRKQRTHLRKERGGLVMQRALVEIEHERDNIIHRQIEAANDPDKPPHETRFGDDLPDTTGLRRINRKKEEEWQ
jgi:hypothetical protein